MVFFCCFLNFSWFITPSKNFITVLSLCDCQSILILTKNEILENNLLSFHFMWCDWLISRIPMKSLLSSAALCAKLHLVPNWKKSCYYNILTAADPDQVKSAQFFPIGPNWKFLKQRVKKTNNSSLLKFCTFTNNVSDSHDGRPLDWIRVENAEPDLGGKKRQKENRFLQWRLSWKCKIIERKKSVFRIRIQIGSGFRDLKKG